jgi:hypothetical protein
MKTLLDVVAWLMLTLAMLSMTVWLMVFVAVAYGHEAPPPPPAGGIACHAGKDC